MTSAVLAATTSSAWLNGLSSALSRASNNSRMRISTLSGSLRVTTTSGFLPDAIDCLSRKPTCGRRPGNRPDAGRIGRMPAASARSGLFNRPRRHWNGQVVHQNLSTRWLRSDKARRGSPGVTTYWACRDDIVAPQADDRVDSGRDRGAAPAGARRRRGPGRQRQHGERTAGAALRQPQDRSGQCARRPGQGPRRRLDILISRIRQMKIELRDMETRLDEAADRNWEISEAQERTRAASRPRGT